MDDESGESAEKDDVTGAGRGELERLGWGWREKRGVDFRDQVKPVESAIRNVKSRIFFLRCIVRTFDRRIGWRWNTSKLLSDAIKRPSHARSTTSSSTLTAWLRSSARWRSFRIRWRIQRSTASVCSL